MITYLSDNQKRMASEEVKLEKRNPGEFRVVKVYPDEEYQKIIGFGGAFTEAAGYVYDSANEENRKKLLDLYFGENGNRYTMGRLHIQSCDFALGNYAYDEDPQDRLLEKFSIDRDREFILPLVKEALKKENGLSLLASPWSPPAFMKTNNEMNHGGKLKEDFRAMWASMIVRYLKEYEQQGVKIQRLTVQNEPAAVQTWDSCVYSGAEEAHFATHYLKPALIHNGYSNVKVLVWDHNKDIIIERINESFSVDEAEESIDGIAFHWYTGTHFEALSRIREKYPDKELIFTEGCVEYSRYKADRSLQFAEMYAEELMGNLKTGCNGYTDWNLYLNKEGGPNHVGNFCDAPVMFDEKTQTIDVKLSYYYIGHFSRFIRPDAVRILGSSFDPDIETVCFKNTDNSIVIVLLNRRDEDKEFTLGINGYSADIKLSGHSIQTLVISEDELVK